MAHQLSCYTPLDKEFKSIRLLAISPHRHPNDHRIDCKLVIHSLKDCPKYRALSYRWGEPDDFGFKIWLNGTLVPIRQNLLCALRVLHATEAFKDAYIWVDALCINQEDLLEKGHQVGMIDEIYKNAIEVIAWLGTNHRVELNDRYLDTTTRSPRHLSVDAFSFLSRAASSKPPYFAPDKRAAHENWAQDYVFSPEVQNEIGDLVEMCYAEYWRRLWIIQEVCLASQLLLMRGRAALDFDMFSDFRRFVLRVEDTGNLPCGIRRIMESRPFKLHEMMRSKYVIEQESWIKTDLRSLLVMSADCLCHDRRDKVFGISGLATDIDENILPVDYSQSLRQLYAAVVMLYPGIGKSASWLQADDSPLISDIMAFSNIIQSSLLRPDFDVSGFAEMRAGRPSVGAIIDVKISMAEVQVLTCPSLGAKRQSGLSGLKVGGRIIRKGTSRSLIASNRATSLRTLLTERPLAFRRAAQ